MMAVRCISCGKPAARLSHIVAYFVLCRQRVPEHLILDTLGLTRICCRAQWIGSIAAEERDCRHLVTRMHKDGLVDNVDAKADPQLTVQLVRQKLAEYAATTAALVSGASMRIAPATTQKRTS